LLSQGSNFGVTDFSAPNFLGFNGQSGCAHGAWTRGYPGEAARTASPSVIGRETIVTRAWVVGGSPAADVRAGGLALPAF
jgi:hypothetical protein